jgi:hypothetical protein
MSNRPRYLSNVIFILMAGLAVARCGYAQDKGHKFSLALFDDYGCKAKGRTQDCSGAVMKEILADGKNAIPILISQLTETARTKEQISDYWSDTRTGDVAYIVLTDLFTESDLHTFNMPAVPDFPTVMKGCDSTAQGCWNEFLRRHGRKSVQQAWLSAWNLRKDQIYWEPNERCFRITKK